MSLEGGLGSFATRVAQEFNTVRGEMPSGGGSASFMQLSNTDVSSYLNTASATVIPLGGSTISLGSDFTKVGNSIRCNFSGTVRITASVFMTTPNIQRANVQMQAYLEGVALPPVFNTSYIRAVSGHNEASCACPSFMASVATGDKIDLRGIRAAANTAGVTMGTVGGSYLLVERIA